MNRQEKKRTNRKKLLFALSFFLTSCSSSGDVIELFNNFIFYRPRWSAGRWFEQEHTK